MESFKKHERFNHLKDGFNPILSCIETDENVKSMYIEDYKNVENINYFANFDELQEKGILNGGFKTYVISRIDSKNKYTTGLYDCTSLIISGVDKESGKNISVLSHQDPDQILYRDSIKKTFIRDLQNTIKEIKEKSKEGSIDSVIVGGNFLNKNKEFIESIKLISDEIKKELKFEPTITTGPKQWSGASNVYFDNKNRRVYLMMPKQEKAVVYNDFDPKDMNEQLNKINE